MVPTIPWLIAGIALAASGALTVPERVGDSIEKLESLLDGDARFPRREDASDRVPLRNQFDAAYRLMRLYEKQQQPAKMTALGLRIAAGEKPFGAWWKPDPSPVRSHGENDRPEDINACLALLVQNADAATLAKLAELWKAVPDCPAKRQLARRQSGGLPAMAETKDIGWQKLPVGVRLIASSANVLALARR